MAATSIHRLSALPGQAALVPTLVRSAYEPGVYRLDNGRVRYALVKAPGAPLTIVSEETATREARLLMDDAAQEADEALRAAAMPSVPLAKPSCVGKCNPATCSACDFAVNGDAPEAVQEPTPSTCNLAALGDALSFASCHVYADDGSIVPNTKLAEGVLIRDGENFDVIAEPVYVKREPSYERVIVSQVFTRRNTMRPIAGRGMIATPAQNRDTLDRFDPAAVEGRIVYGHGFSSGRYVAQGRGRNRAWVWQRDDAKVGITFALPEVAGYQAGGVIVHSHDGQVQVQARMFVTVDGYQLFAPGNVKLGKHTKGLPAKLAQEEMQRVLDNMVRDAKALAAALDAARTLDSESAAILIATKVLDATGDKLTETIAKLHDLAERFSPSLGGIRYVLAAGHVTASSKPASFSAWYFSIASDRAADALQALAGEAAVRRANGEGALIQSVIAIEAKLPALEGDGGAAQRTRRSAILSALRAAALFPRDSSRDLDGLGDRVEGSAHKATSARLLALRAVVGTLASDVRAADTEWWLAHTTDALQVMLDATMATVREGGAS